MIAVPYDLGAGLYSARLVCGPLKAPHRIQTSAGTTWSLPRPLLTPVT